MTARVRAEVLILGAGVSGLTTALVLARQGRTVRIVADRAPLNTTSAVAGASWGPYASDDPRILQWSLATRDTLSELSGSGADTGVRLVLGIEAGHEHIDPPEWARADPEFRVEPDPPVGYVAAFQYRTPLIDTPRYLTYLVQCLRDANITVEQRTVHSFSAVAAEAALIVNCTGLGARRLVIDDELKPSRGQLLLVDQCGVDRFFHDQTDDGDQTYVLPHRDYVVLGGCADVGNENTRVDLDMSAAILKRCLGVVPQLSRARIREHRVGLRPNRSSVRLELDEHTDFPLIHNYGHGGAGMTLSWGCANEVGRLVDSTLGPHGLDSR